jgi:hypothetical protein
VLYVGVESRFSLVAWISGRIESNESTLSIRIPVVPRVAHSYAVSNHTKTNNQPQTCRTAESRQRRIGGTGYPAAKPRIVRRRQYPSLHRLFVIRSSPCLYVILGS